MKNVNNKRLFVPNFYDILLALVILGLSIGSLAWVKTTNSEGDKKAIIYRDSEVLQEILLIESKKVQINNMEFIIDKGRIKVSQSDCPHKICAHTGFISNPGQTIVCVPNKVLVEIVGLSSKKHYNAVSY